MSDMTTVTMPVWFFNMNELVDGVRVAVFAGDRCLFNERVYSYQLTVEIHEPENQELLIRARKAKFLPFETTFRKGDDPVIYPGEGDSGFRSPGTHVHTPTEVIVDALHGLWMTVRKKRKAEKNQ